MSDKWNLSGEQVTGSVLRFDSQVALLRTAVLEVRQAVNCTPAFERATRALLTEGGAVSFTAVPKILSALGQSRQLGALLVDSSGDVLMANKGFHDLTGFNHDSSALDLFFVDDKGQMQRLQNLPWQSVLSSGQFSTCRLSLSDGKRGERLRWLQFCCQPLLAQANLEGVLTIVSEATEEVELEERMHSVIGLLSQQVEELSQPAQQLNQLMERVRTLDNFLPRQNVLSLETQAVEDSIQDDELLYRQLIEIDAIEQMAADVSLESINSAPNEPAISTEAAMAIRAFEDSFNIDLEDADSQMAVSESVVESEIGVQSDVESEIQPHSEPVSESAVQESAVDENAVDENAVDDLVDAASYLSADVNDDGELWSEFSDFESKVHQLDSEESDDSDVTSGAPQLVEEASEEAVISESIIDQPEAALVQESVLEESVSDEPVIDEPVLEEPVSEPITQEQADSIVAEIVADDDLLEPIAEAEEAPQSLNVTIIETPIDENRPVRAHAGKCALIVDDIPVNQKLLVLQLKRLGFVTETANNGKEAVDRLQRFIYDIVFMDCDMPVMDGYDATMAIRKVELETGNHIPIVAMTSYDRAADKERCLACGMDDYLTKGVNASSLSRVIERTVDKARAENGGSEDDEVNAETAPFDAATMAANYSKEELNEVVRLFLNSMETFVNSMQKAIDERNGALVAQLANSIKGPSATLGLQVITKVANDILTYCESEDWPQVRLKYLKLKTVYLRSQEQLRKLCPEVFTEGAHIFG
jgi:CheY-like chemotaxis protein